MIQDKVNIAVKILKYRDYKLCTWPEIMVLVDKIYEKQVSKQEIPQFVKGYYVSKKLK